ncbi:hypothetical protein [Hoeflea poritis]|uniref:DUF768 domain-containing protein n=1 Tax=Hoeflea poritis TaxID=2993659 RepID=A0ABT4VMJ1_9HYPH|nr:hypothetical protein [Hoeflea poritis]MDA4845923.1 hypothetical protein [Hoeflea poritis]
MDAQNEKLKKSMLNRWAARIVADLPENDDDATKVLDMAREMVLTVGTHAEPIDKDDPQKPGENVTQIYPGNR